MDLHAASLVNSRKGCWSFIQAELHIHQYIGIGCDSKFLTVVTFFNPAEVNAVSCM